MFSPSTTLHGSRKLTQASSDGVVCHNTAWLGVDYVCWFNLNYPGCLVRIFSLWLLTHITMRFREEQHPAHINADISSATEAPNDRFQALQAARDLIWSVCVCHREGSFFPQNTRVFLFLWIRLLLNCHPSGWEDLFSPGVIELPLFCLRRACTNASDQKLGCFNLWYMQVTNWFSFIF